MKKRNIISILVLAIAVTMLFTACAGTENKPAPTEAGANAATGAPADTTPAQAPEENPTEPATEPAEQPTEVPEEPTAAPTEEPTANPSAPRFIAPETDYYFDFTSYGEDEIVPGPGAATGIDYETDGVRISPLAFDPYFFMYFYDEHPTPDYRYIAFKVRPHATDRGGEVRYTTSTDERGWAMVPYQYSTADKWQVIALDLSGALYMNPDTLDGDFTSIRFDHYTDDGLPSELDPEVYYVTLESVALFDSFDKAKAFAGLYEWPAE